MIRPFTCVCFLAACGSGLYLYQSKHRVQVLDREIERTVRATDEMRERIRVLHAEWTLQNDPQRLQALADQLLNLKTVTPGQFTSMAELDNRLPTVRAPEPPPEPPSPLVAQGESQIEEPRPVPVAAPPPSPTVKPVQVVAVSPPRPPEHRPPPPRPMVAEVQPARPPRSEHVATPPRAIAVAAPVAMTSGSALGMARGAAPPPPRPMPVSASDWVTGGGGG